MGYSIELVDKDNEIMMTKSAFIKNSNISCAEVDPDTDELTPVPDKEARIGITYNYSSYYYEATEGDERFAHEDDSQLVYGIRGLYGKTPYESIPMLRDMIKRIEDKYKKNGDWIITSRSRNIYFDGDGNIIDDPIKAMLDHEALTVESEIYEISEGDTSSYWESTAANAVAPLYDMLHMATDNITNECYWSGD